MSTPWVIGAAAVWVLAWLTAPPRPEPVDPQPFEGEAVLSTDVIEGRFGPWAIAETEIGPVLLDLQEPAPLVPGDVVRLGGELRGGPGRAGGRTYRAVVLVRHLELTGRSRGLHLTLGNAVRSHVVERLSPYDDGRALLAGFLIGDTSGLSRFDAEAMRRSGLAHFVAVSGSNVALVLVMVAIAAGPLSLGPRRRAVLGLIAIPIYAAATRFEPSVMRASVMAGIALVGRLTGFVLEAWQLLSLAVVVLIASDPGLTSSAGFQMSVAATAGVIAGARWPIRGGKVQRALAVTVGAQLTVAPLLIAHFGSIPLMSPLANLVAAPLVTAATLSGAIAVIGPDQLIEASAWLAEVVIWLARGASAWPQLDGAAAATLMSAGLVVWRFRALRMPTAAVAAAGLVLSIASQGAELPESGAVVLDVGQGDAILLHSQGRFALVDGGPDQLVLIDKLRRYGVTQLDLVVLTHVHADHATGLVGLVGRVGIRRVWADPEPHGTEASTALFEALGRAGIPLSVPDVGDSVDLGSLTLTVEGPLRRYASANDQSLVLMVEGTHRSMLLSGDIETFAQAELGHLRSDVLKVPHQGGATSDPDWLESVGSQLAVISVGPNQFGHPADWVVEVLEASGSTVVRTDEAGDVPVPLG